MMHTLLWALKDNWHISSLLPLLVALSFGVALLYGRRTARWGRWWLLLVVAGYWMMATPGGSALVSARLIRGQHSLASASEASGAQAVVVLGAGIIVRQAGGIASADLGASALRVIEGVRLYRLLGDPLLIVSGGNTARLSPPQPEGEAMRRAAIALGVPAARVIADNDSMTTYEQAQTMTRLLAERRISRFVLVTSPAHMPRSIAVFRSGGLDPIPSAAAMRSEPSLSPWSIVPDRESLGISDAALYEYAAGVYYWLRGWVKPPVR